MEKPAESAGSIGTARVTKYAWSVKHVNRDLETNHAPMLTNAVSLSIVFLNESIRLDYLEGTIFSSTISQTVIMNKDRIDVRGSQGTIL
jgi:hypothetical protein